MNPSYYSGQAPCSDLESIIRLLRWPRSLSGTRHDIRGLQTPDQVEGRLCPMATSQRQKRVTTEHLVEGEEKEVILRLFDKLTARVSGSLSQFMTCICVYCLVKCKKGGELCKQQ